MRIFNFAANMNDGADTSGSVGGFDSRVELYEDTVEQGFSREAYDPDEALEDDADSGNWGAQQTSQEDVEGSGKSDPNAKGKPQEPSFSPYEFKGKVNGEQLAQKFESKKDLDVAIARGLQAPKIYEALQAAKADIGKLKEDAEWANDILELAKTSPTDFFANVVEELVPEEVLAEYVWHKYNHFNKLANLSPEERAREQQLKAAEKLMKEQAFNEEKRKLAEVAQGKARLEQEKAELMGWKHKELQTWERVLPAHAKASLEEYMQTAMLTAQAHLNAGKQYGTKEMSAHLKRLLTPLVSNPQNPVQARREEAAKNQATAEANKEKLQSLVGNTEQQTQRARVPRKAMWDQIKRDTIAQLTS